MKLNENIRLFRTYRNITQSQLAEQLGKSKNVISNWERGDNQPDPDTIEQLCKIFDVTPNQIFGWEENPEIAAYFEEQRQNSERIKELREQREKIDDEIATLVKKSLHQTSVFEILDLFDNFGSDNSDE